MRAADYLAAQARAMTEKALLEQVRRAAAVLGLACYHTHDSRRSEPGFPDVVLVGRRGVLWRELKTERGRLTAPQQVWLDRLATTGQDARVWRPSDLISGAVVDEMKGVR